MTFHIVNNDQSIVPQVTSNNEHDLRPKLEIILDSEFIALRGTGVDVEPARLSGQVVLYLSESTSIKEITLQFRGKTRLPVDETGHAVTYILCTHDWSFLEGHRKHPHTLKAGCHFFPFQLQIGGSLPSSVSTLAFGGAFVSYKLRAHVSRPGFAHNLDTTIPVPIIRSFSAEALEYQQTLDLENTWPDKVMYSILLPHKAWAGGDCLTAQVKFAPLTKGVRILSIKTGILETTKVYGLMKEYTNSVCSFMHHIINGTAVPVPQHFPPVASTSANTPATTPGSLPSAVNANFPSLYSSTSTSASVHTTHITSHMNHNMHHTDSRGFEESSTLAGHTEEEERHDDIVSFLSLEIPLVVTPSHNLDPIHISHRVRWTILIGNADGHTSELRCSLPIHILDYRLLEEAKIYSAATRRLLIGGPELPPTTEQESELPSYNAHVRDRVANMYLSDTAVMRINNPWVANGTSPTIHIDHTSSSSPSGVGSPVEAHALSHLPQSLSDGGSHSLNWVNSELLLSLSHTAPHQPQSTPPNSTDTSQISSRQPSRPSSRVASRHSSRATSRPHSPVGYRPPPVSNSDESYLHSGNASRTFHGLFHASMKPFASILHPNWLQRSSTRGPLPQGPAARGENIQSTRITCPQIQRNLDQLHHAFTTVPDYGVASQGFLGGIPPLESLRGLPSYVEAERSHLRLVATLN